MKSKPYSEAGAVRAVAVAVMVFGLAGMLNTAQAQKGAESGTLNAKDQKAVLKRDPFWPVGYVPKNITSVVQRDSSERSASTTVDNSWNEAMKKVVISGVSSGTDNAYFAVINGEIKSVGDTVTINHGGTIYTWAVDEIKPPSSVKLRRVSAR